MPLVPWGRLGRRSARRWQPRRSLITFEGAEASVAWTGDAVVKTDARVTIARAVDAETGARFATTGPSVRTVRQRQFSRKRASLFVIGTVLLRVVPRRVGVQDPLAVVTSPGALSAALLNIGRALPAAGDSLGIVIDGDGLDLAFGALKVERGPCLQRRQLLVREPATARDPSPEAARPSPG